MGSWSKNKENDQNVKSKGPEEDQSILLHGFLTELPVHWDEPEADMFLDTSQTQLKNYSYPATYTRPLPPNHL